MKKYLKKHFNEFFMLSMSEQKGILILATFSLLIVVLNYLLPFIIPNNNTNPTDFIIQVEHFKKARQKTADSIYANKLQNKGQLTDSLAKIRLKPFLFNPNNLAVEKWKAIGLTEKQIRTIKNYESKGGRFKTKEDLQKIYVISESEYRILEPYINIPAAKTKSYAQQKTRTTAKFKRTKINTADSAILVQNLNLSPWLAARIVKFRKLLGGFSNANQLYEVYGFDSSEVQKRSNFVVVDTTAILKLDINAGDFKTLVRHPYLPYDLVVGIFELRTDADSTITLRMLLDSGKISPDQFKKLAPYIKRN